jgi:hypothetical protein
LFIPTHQETFPLEISVNLDKSRNLRLHRVEGRVTLVGLREALASFYQENPECRDMDSIWDLTETEIALSPEEIQDLASFVSQQWGRTEGVRSALVLSEDLAFGLGRIYGGYLEGQTRGQVGFFRGLTEALNWIGQGAPPGGGGES